MGRKRKIHIKCKCGKPTRSKSSGHCRDCYNAYQRANRKKHSELTEEQRQKANCRAYLHVYIKRGKIIKAAHCSFPGCTEAKVEAHHEDYNQPLNVTWLCREHHLSLHKLS